MSRRYTDITGQRFGMLVALAPALHRRRSHQGAIMWHCRCDCGRSSIVSGHDLRKGHKQSCGCARGGARFAAERRAMNAALAPVIADEARRRQLGEQFGRGEISFAVLRQRIRAIRARPPRINVDRNAAPSDTHELAADAQPVDRAGAAQDC